MSKQIVDRIKSAEVVAITIEAYGPRIIAGASSVLAPYAEPGPGEEMVAPLLGVCGRVLRASAERLRTTEEAHAQELGDDAGPRAARDAAVEALRAAVVALKPLVEGAYGRAGLSAVGLGEPVPDATPETLLS